MSETPTPQTTVHASRPITLYEVIGNHPIHARPDKRNLSFTEAVNYSEELCKAGFEGVTIREQGSVSPDSASTEGQRFMTRNTDAVTDCHPTDRKSTRLNSSP